MNLVTDSTPDQEQGNPLSLYSAKMTASEPRVLEKTGLRLPRIVFGTSCLGNLFQVIQDDTRHAIVSEVVRHSIPAVFDSAGKYGAGLALEVLGDSLRKLHVPPARVLISNKLGWYRVPLREGQPTFEPGVWADLRHDAELRISYEGIIQCFEQGCALIGPGYTSRMVSVHDPDQFLDGAKTPWERAQRFKNLVDAYRALFELKAKGNVDAVGIGSKNWRVIREVSERVDLDWVMLACSLTLFSHPRELLDFVSHLHSRGVGVINSAVFHSGFLTGGAWFDYRKPSLHDDSHLYVWRDSFFRVCRRFGVRPADACVQFGLALPGVIAVALNTGKPERIKDNIQTATQEIPSRFWRALKEEGLVDKDYPFASS